MSHVCETKQSNVPQWENKVKKSQQTCILSTHSQTLVTTCQVTSHDKHGVAAYLKTPSPSPILCIIGKKAAECFWQGEEDVIPRVRGEARKLRGKGY